MSGVNKVIILGRLGKDPEVRMTPGGQHVCSMSIATSESWLKDGQKEERTEWHKVVLWGRQAELAGKYLKKGRNVYIEGKLQTRSWDDQQSGQKRYTTEIVGSVMNFIDGGANTGTGRNSEGPDAGDAGSDPFYSQPSSSGGGFDNPAPRTNSQPAQNSYRGSEIDDEVPF